MLFNIHFFAYLAVSLGLRPFEPTDSVAHSDLLQEGVALGLREVRRLHLAKVELYSTVVADDMGEKGLTIQSVLVDLESDSWFPAILGEGQHQLLALKVLSEESKTQKFNKMKMYVPVILQSRLNFQNNKKKRWQFIHLDKI